MAVFTDFTVASDEFPCGETIASADAGAVIDLDEVVPTDEGICLYVWIQDGDPEAIQQRVRQSSSIIEIACLDVVDNRSLFRLTSQCTTEGILTALIQNDAVLLEGTSNSDWEFRVRFPDHARLADFYNTCHETGVTPRMNRIYTMVDNQRGGYLFDLSPAQREALIQAIEGGYYNVPRDMTLEELAGGLGITRQAASERIRRGSGKVLHTVLFEALPTIDDNP